MHACLQTEGEISKKDKLEKGTPFQCWGLEPFGECMVVAHWIQRRYWFAQASAGPWLLGQQEPFKYKHSGQCTSMRSGLPVWAGGLE